MATFDWNIAPMQASAELSLSTQTGLTAPQRACLDAIEAYAARTRTMPSVENLRVTLGMSSKAGVFRLLRQLEDRGRIVRLPRRSRAIRVLSDPECPRCQGRLVP